MVLEKPGFYAFGKLLLRKISPHEQKLLLPTRKPGFYVRFYACSTVDWATLESDRPPQSTLRLASKAQASQQ
jgi:hypothetical protein